MAIIQAGNGGGSLWNTLASIAGVALAPITAGTSMAWAPGVIGLGAGLANGNPVQAITGALGAGIGSGAVGNLANAGVDAAGNATKTLTTAGKLGQGLNTMSAQAGMVGNGSGTTATNHGGQQGYVGTTNSLSGNKPWYQVG